LQFIVGFSCVLCDDQGDMLHSWQRTGCWQANWTDIFLTISCPLLQLSTYQNTILQLGATSQHTYASCQWMSAADNLPLSTAAHHWQMQSSCYKGTYAIFCYHLLCEYSDTPVP
jgi:hypothetical protein